MLSEINPSAIGVLPELDPWLQACFWLRLFRGGECRDLQAQALAFDRLIEVITRRAAECGDQLVIRDWALVAYPGFHDREPCLELEPPKPIPAEAVSERLANRDDRAIGRGLARVEEPGWITVA